MTILKYSLSRKHEILTDVVSQKRDLLTDCQGGTDRVTMRVECEYVGCYVQLKCVIIVIRILKFPVEC